MTTSRIRALPRNPRPLPEPRAPSPEPRARSAGDELHRRVHRVAAELRAVDGEPARQRVAHLEAHDYEARLRRGVERFGGERDAEELAVGAGLAQVAVAELRVPGEDAAV